MSDANQTTTGADIGVYGMGVMGTSLARNFASRGYRVAITNIVPERLDEVIENYGHEGDFLASSSLHDFVQSLAKPRTVLIMVPAGKPTDEVILALAGEMEEGDIIIDGGNTHFPDTRRREAAMRERGLHFVGAGVSGGEEGALKGPSIMPGGSAKSYERLGPIFESIAAQVDGQPCCVYVGPDGAGHFVKMVHNGIEYADMELISEAAKILREGLNLEPEQIGHIFEEWNRGDLNSYLMEISADIARQKDPRSGKPLVDVIVDQGAQKGTGRWTVQNALDLNVPITGIAEATFARAISGSVPQREAAQATLPAETLVVDFGDPDEFIEDVRRSLYASKIIAYSQGFDQIRAASEEYGWDIKLGQMAMIWRGGCIIRAQFLDRITEAYDRDPGLPLLIADPYFAQVMRDSVASWRRVVSKASLAGIPCPVFSSSLSYYDSLRSKRLPASLVQAQRDYFGAHTYQRIDDDGAFHLLWSGDRSEQRRG